MTKTPQEKNRRLLLAGFGRSGLERGEAGNKPTLHFVGIGAVVERFDVGGTASAPQEQDTRARGDTGGKDFGVDFFSIAAVDLDALIGGDLGDVAEGTHGRAASTSGAGLFVASDSEPSDICKGRSLA